MRAVSACLLFAVAAALVSAQNCVAPSTNVFDAPSTCGIANQCKSALCACTGSSAAYPTCLATNTGSCSATQACFARYAACIMTTTASRSNTSDACSTFGNNLYIAQLAAAASSTFNTTGLALSCGYATCLLGNVTGNTASCSGSAISTAVCNPANLIVTTAAPGVVYDIVFTLRISGNSWTVLLANATAKAQTSTALAADLAKLWGIDAKFIVIQSLESGSLVANVAVVQGSGKSPATLQSVITATTNSSSWLSSLQSVYSTVSNEVLSTLGVTVTQTAAPTTLAPGATPSPNAATPAPTSSAVSAAGVWAVAAVAAVAALWA